MTWEQGGLTRECLNCGSHTCLPSLYLKPEESPRKTQKKLKFPYVLDLGARWTHQEMSKFRKPYTFTFLIPKARRTTISIPKIKVFISHKFSNSNFQIHIDIIDIVKIIIKRLSLLSLSYVKMFHIYKCCFIFLYFVIDFHDEII